MSNLWTLLLAFGLVLAAIDQFRSGGRALTTWAVILTLVFLLRDVLAG